MLRYKWVRLFLKFLGLALGFLLIASACNDQWAPPASSSQCDPAGRDVLTDDPRWPAFQSTGHRYACLQALWSQAKQAKTQMVVVKLDGTVLNIDAFNADPNSTKPLQLGFATKGQFGGEHPKISLFVFGTGDNTPENQRLCTESMAGAAYNCLEANSAECWFLWQLNLSTDGGSASSCELLTRTPDVRPEGGPEVGPEPFIEPAQDAGSVDEPGQPELLPPDAMSEPAQEPLQERLRPDVLVIEEPSEQGPDTPCQDGEMRACRTSQMGLCGEGVQTCMKGIWLLCVSRQITPLSEVCDGKDNDCDGKIDNGLSCGPICTTKPCVTTIVGQQDLMQGSPLRTWFVQPTGVAVDSKGNVFVADAARHRILKYDAATKTVSVFAGSGVRGLSDAQGQLAQFDTPVALAIGSKDEIYVADQGNKGIRVITASGLVSSLNSTFRINRSFTALAYFQNPRSREEVLYFLSLSNHRVYFVNFPSGAISVHAGDQNQAGFINSNAGAPLFRSPAGLAVDTSGNVYVADTGNHAIRMITPKGVVTTIAGTGSPGAVDLTGQSASFSSPRGVVVDAKGAIYVADTGNHAIRKIDLSHKVTTLNKASKGFANGSIGAALFDGLQGLALDSQGALYVADTGNLFVRKVTIHSSSPMATTLIGVGVAGFYDDVAENARLHRPMGLASDGVGGLLIADAGNARIRRLDATGKVSTFSGSGTPGFKDGTATASQYHSPTGITSMGNGKFVVTDAGGNHLRIVDAAGSQLITKSNQSGYKNSSANSLFFKPQGVVFGISPLNTNMPCAFVADTDNHCIRIIYNFLSGTTVVRLAGYEKSGGMTGCIPGFVDKFRGDAAFVNPDGLALDGMGNLYIADTGNHAIRKIDTKGVVTTLAGQNVAGKGVAGYADATGTWAKFRSPRGLAVDASGNVYVADTGNHAIRKITPAGVVTTIAGVCVGNSCTAGFGDGSGLSAFFREPARIILDLQGNLLVADTMNHRIRKITLK